MKKLLIFLLLLSGCAAGNYGTSEYTLNQDGTFTVKSGKEVGHVEAVMNKDGDKQFVYFSASDVKAFEGQKIGAAVSLEVTNAVKEVLPQLVSEAVKAALGAKMIEGTGEAVKGLAPLMMNGNN